MRRQRRRRWAFIKAILVIIFLGSTFYFSYVTGQELAHIEVAVLREQLGEAKSRIGDLEADNGELAAETQAAKVAVSDWRSRYEKDVPQGELAELLQLAESKVESGVPMERIRFVVSAVKSQRSCANEPDTKRFLVRTPIYKGANDAVTFAKGAITVSARGASVVNANGGKESWFDAAKPLTVKVAEIGGKSSEIEGLLPLHFSLVRGDIEHLFTLRKGDKRGFVRVTEDTCAYP
jgi:hypothetical protein